MMKEDAREFAMGVTTRGQRKQQQQQQRQKQGQDDSNSNRRVQEAER